MQGSIPGLRVASETAAPQGTVALVFTDIRNSTALWETNPGMQNAMRIHHELMRRLIRAFDGYEVKTEGDAFMVSFFSVTSAVLWCFTVQLELLRADWPVELIMSEEGKELYGKAFLERTHTDANSAIFDRSTRRTHLSRTVCPNGCTHRSADLRAGPCQSSYGLPRSRCKSRC